LQEKSFKKLLKDYHLVGPNALDFENMSAAQEPHLPSKGQFLVYRADDGRVKIDVRLENETVWLMQQQMAELFQTTQQNISLHLQNIYEEGELQPEATHKDSLSVRQEGERHVQRLIEFYNLDAIISVGYRVKSAVATRFRIWATQKLREFIVKGFVLDDERLRSPLLGQVCLANDEPRRMLAK
jgi:hypothetical protein